MSYILKDGRLIAETADDLKEGDWIFFSYKHKNGELIDRDIGVISNNEEKWATEVLEMEKKGTDCDYAYKVNRWSKTDYLVAPINFEGGK